jgi:phosphoadenosine phosphosulfate reductase
MKPILWKIPPVNTSPDVVEALHQRLINRLNQICGKYNQVKFATSLAAEDMAITDAIVCGSFPIQIFTLNTGRLHQETLEMLATVEKHYGIDIQVVTPNPTAVDEYVNHLGLNAFYESELAKKMCCDIRKVKPLNAALQSADAWLTGQRKAQAVTRADLEFEEFDTDRGIAKFNPLLDFTDEDVWSFVIGRDVPIHPLHRMGYPSIGCEPCTRPIKDGEDIRAGRWWWLQQASKECGLHVAQEGNQ